MRADFLYADNHRDKLNFHHWPRPCTDHGLAARSDHAKARDAARRANKRAWRLLQKKPRTLHGVRQMYRP